MLSGILLLFFLLIAILLTKRIPYDCKQQIAQIDALLPQTQCGKCDYAGCQPYANAIVSKGESIYKCSTGGQQTLNLLLALTGHTQMSTMQLPTPTMAVAVIDEAECIGCTKCITACPVDAIVGTSKQMHGIMTKYCTGCGLCLPTCPVDCIKLFPSTA